MIPIQFSVDNVDNSVNNCPLKEKIVENLSLTSRSYFHRVFERFPVFFFSTT